MSLFRFCVSELCTITRIANVPLTPMVKILSDLIINQTIGSSVQVNRSLQLCFRISCFLTVCHQINTNNQNLKFLADPPHKIWEKHFNFPFFIFYLFIYFCWDWLFGGGELYPYTPSLCMPQYWVLSLCSLNPLIDIFYSMVCTDITWSSTIKTSLVKIKHVRCKNYTVTANKIVN